MQWGLENISSSELCEWEIYFSQNPFESDRQDTRNAILCHLIYTMNKGKNKALEIKDFMPKFENTSDKKKLNEHIESVESMKKKIGVLDMLFKRGG